MLNMQKTKLQANMVKKTIEDILAAMQFTSETC